MKNPLIALLIDNKGKGFFRAEASGDEATIYLYDVIVSDDYWGGISASTFIKELIGIDAKTINLRINSPGGDVFASQAMIQAIREKGAKVIAHIDGVAASAASSVALAADEVTIAPGAMYMIHKAMTVAWGNADEMQKTVDLLNKVDGVLVAQYAAETGQDPTQILDWMAAETWFTAEEAVSNGFADRVAEKASKPANAWNLAAWANAPKPANAAPPPAPENTPPPIDATEHLRRRLRLAETQPA